MTDMVAKVTDFFFFFATKISDLGGGSHSSEFGQNCGYFQLVFVKTSGFLVRPPSDHLSQIRLTDQKDQTSRSVWVWLTNFANFAKIAFKQTKTH